MLNRIVAATIAAFIFTGALIAGLTSIFIDPYVEATNWGINLFDFYEENTQPNKIYFIGDSTAEMGIDPIIIENRLRSSNLSFNVYNLAYPEDLPSLRAIELPNIIKSRPKIVVICSFYRRWLTPYPYLSQSRQYPYAEARFILASDKIELDPYVESLINRSVLDSIKLDPIRLTAYKGRFIVPSIELKLSHMGIIDYKPDLSGWDLFDFKSQMNLTEDAVKPFSFPNCSLSGGADNENALAFRYMVSRLKEKGIDVIIINMPLCPYWPMCQNDSKILDDFMKPTGCPYYDLGSLCSIEEFADNTHVNAAGRRNLTRKISEILLSEAKNVPQ